MAVTEFSEPAVSNFENHCNQLLAEADLPPIWRPERVSPDLVKYGQVIAKLAINPEVHIYTLTRIMQMIGNIAVKSRANYFSLPLPASAESFRAYKAIEKGRGNCIATHELMYGIFSNVGLGEHVIGTWDGTHATTGLVVGPNSLRTDGGNKKAHPVNVPSERRAWSEASQNKFVVRYNYYDEAENTYESRPFEKIDQLSLNPWRSQKLILPGAAAVVMFSARSAAIGNNPKYDRARQVLSDYVPITVE